MIEAIEIRKVRSLDGLHYSFGLLNHFYLDLYETCCSIPTDNSQIVKALANCWGFIDALHRVREIAQSIPDLSVSHPEMRNFLSKTSLAEDYRHYIQHLRGELAKDPPNKFPVWGSLSWVDPDNEEISHLVILGANIEGTSYSGCVYDTEEKRWVSRVTLGVENHSFNFEPIREASQRFKEFVIPYLIEGASEYVKFHDKLQILTISIESKNTA
jgi:hypothetical protein